MSYFFAKLKKFSEKHSILDMIFLVSLKSKTSGEADDSMIILNMATQENIGKDARYKAVEQSLELSIESLMDDGIYSLALSQIGCGYGGLSWHRVKKMLEKIANKYLDFTLEIWTYEK